MIRWERGRAEVDRLLERGRLTRVASNRELADSYLAQTRGHVTAAETVKVIDPSGAFNLTYDAAKMALAAVLLCQGLRSRG